MRIQLTDVAKGRKQRALPPTSLAYETGRASLACAETEQRPTVLGLIASGRMRPDSGTVVIDGRSDAAALRRSVALVDAPDVSEPEPNIPVAGVVAEELMFAGRRSDPFSTRQWIAEHGLATVASTPIGNISPEHRIRLLCELAALRSGVTGLVLTSPDRHGGEPALWWAIAQSFAARGLAVLVIAGRASQAVIEAGEPAVTAPLNATPASPTEGRPELEPAASDIRRIAPSSEKPDEDLRNADDSPTFAHDQHPESDEPMDAAPPAEHESAPMATDAGSADTDTDTDEGRQS